MTADQKRFLKLIEAIQNLYREPVYKAIRGQIIFFISKYEQGFIDYNLPKKPLTKTLRALHEEAGVRNGVEVRRQIKRNLKKSASEEDNRLIWSINKYFQEHLLEKAVVHITETTKKQIHRVMMEANEKGWGMDKTVRALKETDITKARAELIVRTETMKAANVGAMIAAADMGIEVQKQWISAQDNRTRRIPRNQYDHLHMNGVVKDYNQPFIVPSTKTLDAMQYPGDPSGSAGNVCNCRCTVAFIPLRNADRKPILTDIYEPTVPTGVAVITDNPFKRIIQQAMDITITYLVIRGLVDAINNFFSD